MLFLQLRKQCRSAEAGREEEEKKRKGGRVRRGTEEEQLHTHVRVPSSSERTILCDFCGAHLSPHKKTVFWHEQVWGDQVLPGRIIDTGEGGVLVGPSSSLLVLRE